MLIGPHAESTSGIGLNPTTNNNTRVTRVHVLSAALRVSTASYFELTRDNWKNENVETLV